MDDTNFLNYISYLFNLHSLDEVLYVDIMMIKVYASSSIQVIINVNLVHLKSMFGHCKVQNRACFDCMNVLRKHFPTTYIL